jgi:hypothetical protein
MPTAAGNLVRVQIEAERDRFSIFAGHPGILAGRAGFGVLEAVLRHRFFSFTAKHTTEGPQSREKNEKCCDFCDILLDIRVRLQDIQTAMTEPTLAPRGIVGTFFKDSGGRIRLDSLTAITESVSTWDGKVRTGRDGYDVDWSRTYGCYLFHMSSGGCDMVIPVSGIYWLSGPAQVKEKPCEFIHYADKPPWKSKKTRAIRQRNRTRRLPKLPKYFDVKPGEDLLDWLETNGIQEDAVWCSTCHDHLPGDQLCRHCWWCDKTGDYSTPDERCKCKNRDECNLDEVEE